jgi:hypothetical protein
MHLTQPVSTGTALLILAVYALAVMRLTRLINADTITSFVRLYPATRVREATLQADEAAAHGQREILNAALKRQQRWATVFDFVQCPWCIGMWWPLLTAWAPMLLIGWFAQPWYLDVVVYLGVVLATSHLVGVCARFADTEEIEIEDAAVGDG